MRIRPRSVFPARPIFVRLIAAALILPASAVNSATVWEGINRDVGKLVVYLDKDSVARDGNTEKAWVLFDFVKAQNAPFGFERYRSVKEQVVVRCADRSYAREKEIKYSGPHARGEVVGRHTWKPGEQQFEKGVPFTNSQAIVDFVCAPATLHVGQAERQFSGKP